MAETAIPVQLGMLLAGRGALADARVRQTLATQRLNMRSMFTLSHLARGPVNQQSLIDLLGVDPSALVAVLNELEGLGYASRERDPADRRRHIVRITTRGATALEVVDKVLKRADDDLFAALSSAERDQLEHLLSKVAGADGCG
ncbi:MarR family winged helix-turn-helix transcriptional regulator [Actinoplanes sp. L3-i22]|uniref:MarR family winged helix-turn-helix transcriptional regulator n=1 Tax=Actinoplanes sp. L3-i22 TaxID=2836373 RepID=UPI001C843298|nr:MarR family transcriptional regulator [Actinoplanes sp. L3-i22]